MLGRVGARKLNLTKGLKSLIAARQSVNVPVINCDSIEESWFLSGFYAKICRSDSVFKTQTHICTSWSLLFVLLSLPKSVKSQVGPYLFRIFSDSRLIWAGLVTGTGVMSIYEGFMNGAANFQKISPTLLCVRTRYRGKIPGIDHEFLDRFWGFDYIHIRMDQIFNNFTLIDQNSINKLNFVHFFMINWIIKRDSGQMYEINKPSKFIHLPESN